MEEDYISLLKKHNQEHLLNFLKKCDNVQKENLIKQIYNIDFEKLDELKYLINNISDLSLENKLDHLKYVDKSLMKKEQKEKLKSLAEDVFRKNEYAVVTMAGGQGTRLGYSGPKGTFLLEISPKPKYLFEILADSLKEYNEKYNVILNWYIMTSTENNIQTINFLKEHNYFGYPANNIHFFNQENLPLINEEGKLILDENFKIKEAANGNGCTFSSLKNTGMLEDMKSRGIKWVFIGAVDNPLLNMADEILLGQTISDGNQVASKTVVKDYPEERVGVFGKKNGKITVIEYSELPEELAKMRNENGELIYGEAHIMCNLFSLEAIEKIANEKLPYHLAHKKMNYLDENGNFIIAKEPNGYKFETFIFDGFSYFDTITLLRGKRCEDFAPIKNKEGKDSPKTAIELFEAKK